MFLSVLFFFFWGLGVGGEFLNRIMSLWWCCLESEALANLWWLQCYLQLGGRGLYSISCKENLIFYWVCCSIQSGNASSLGRPSKEHQIITYQLDYVIFWIGFLFGVSPKPKRVRVWPSVKRSEQQKPDGIWVSERLCLDQWLMASLNYSPSLSVSLWVFCLLSDCWFLKVCICPSISQLHFFLFH